MVYEKFTKAAGFNRWHDMVPMVSTSQLSYADSIDIGARGLAASRGLGAAAEAPIE